MLLCIILGPVDAVIVLNKDTPQIERLIKILGVASIDMIIGIITIKALLKFRKLLKGNSSEEVVASKNSSSIMLVHILFLGLNVLMLIFFGVFLIWKICGGMNMHAYGLLEIIWPFVAKYS